MTLTRDLAWLLGEFATVAHVVIAVWVTCHVLLNKRAVGSAVAWIGIAWLSLFVGGALYFGTLLVAWWLLAAAASPNAYAGIGTFMSSFLGRLILFGYTWALMHHLLSGIRHFCWDLGYGFKPAEREALTWGALIGGIALTVLLWVAAYAMGGGR